MAIKTKCLIVDDEPLAIEVIEAHIERCGDLEIIASCNNAVKALEILRQNDIDLIFLDIQMPKLTGIDFLKSLKRPPKVIFTTAYREYAMEGYELDVIDYLLKPISFERFIKAVNKYYQQISPDLLIYNESECSNISKGSFFYVKSNKKIFKIFLQDIIYIESLKDYVKIVTPKRSVVTKQQISSFEEKLPFEQFLRIHRSFIVSISKIEAFTASSIDLENDQELPIGRSYKNSVFKSLKIDEELI